MYGGCLLRILFHFLTKNVMKSAMRVCKTLLWRKERFRGQHILGFAIAFIAVGMNIGAALIAYLFTRG